MKTKLTILLVLLSFGLFAQPIEPDQEVYLKNLGSSWKLIETHSWPNAPTIENDSVVKKTNPPTAIHSRVIPLPVGDTIYEWGGFEVWYYKSGKAELRRYLRKKVPALRDKPENELWFDYRKKAIQNNYTPEQFLNYQPVKDMWYIEPPRDTISQ